MHASTHAGTDMHVGVRTRTLTRTRACTHAPPSPPPPTALTLSPRSAPHPPTPQVYEERRKESLKVMAETESRRAQIQETVRHGRTGTRAHGRRHRETQEQMNTCTHALRKNGSYVHMNTGAQAHIHTCVGTERHRHKATRPQGHKHRHACTCTQAHRHKRTGTGTQAQAHAYMHTCTGTPADKGARRMCTKA